MGEEYNILPYSRLDAVAHGGDPQDRAASLFPVPCSLKPRNLYLTQLKTAIFVFNFRFSKKNEPEYKSRY
ncbi:hypothetical protein [Moorena producens]|uniref:hypothetical protein n=1 Tax=Moorena producens TaxID=1155739 RepID=UPI003C7246D4